MIKIICVGKLKEKYLVDGVKEYVKRIGGYSKINIIELNDEKIPDKASALEEKVIKEKEGKKILDKIAADEYLILLDVSGKLLSSEEMASHMEQCFVSGKSKITFVIGGSLGHEQEILSRANLRLSFSKMTFPHQLMRLILVEQIYRSFKIMKNETYHK